MLLQPTSTTSGSRAAETAFFLLLFVAVGLGLILMIDLMVTPVITNAPSAWEHTENQNGQSTGSTLTSDLLLFFAVIVLLLLLLMLARERGVATRFDQWIEHRVTGKTKNGQNATSRAGQAPAKLSMRGLFEPAPPRRASTASVGGTLDAEVQRTIAELEAGLKELKKPLPEQTYERAGDDDPPGNAAAPVASAPVAEAVGEPVTMA